MQQKKNLAETFEKKKRVTISGEESPDKEKSKRPVSRNLLVKKQMAEQLMTLGLSKESITRILHIRLNDERI